MCPDFRKIPLGDIDLRTEITLDEESGLVRRQRGRASVRRMYSARIKALDMTVALYEGENAEADWRRDISKYVWLR
jgi:hypothetical protein